MQTKSIMNNLSLELHFYLKESTIWNFNLWNKARFKRFVALCWHHKMCQIKNTQFKRHFNQESTADVLKIIGILSSRGLHVLCTYVCMYMIYVVPPGPLRPPPCSGRVPSTQAFIWLAPASLNISLLVLLSFFDSFITTEGSGADTSIRAA